MCLKLEIKECGLIYNVIKKKKNTYAQDAGLTWKGIYACLPLTGPTVKPVYPAIAP